MVCCNVFFMLQVDAMLQNLEKEIDDVDAKIGDRWQLLDRYLILSRCWFLCGLLWVLLLLKPL